MTMTEPAQSPWWKGARGEWLVVLQVALMVLVLFGPRTFAGAPAFPFPAACLVAGVVLMILGLVLFAPAIVSLGARRITPLPYPREGTTLVDTGAYGIVRHPMYGGGVIFSFGWALSVNGWLTLAYALALFLFADYKSRHEERWLSQRFPEYADYRRRVRKLLPFIYVLLVAVLAFPADASQDAQSLADGRRALAVTYADGRTMHQVLRASGESWTSLFPRRPGAETAREGLALSALGFRYGVHGMDLLVTISLIYGTPHQKTIVVTTARINGSGPMTIGELAAYGVEPIQLAIVDTVPAVLFPPVTASASPMLDVRVTPAGGDPPIYRIEVANVSTHALLTFDYETSTAGRPAVSGRRKTERDEALIPAGGRYHFQVSPPARASAPGDAPRYAPFDRFAIVSVLWADGTIEGDRERSSMEYVGGLGRAWQLRRIIEVLRSAAGNGAASAAAVRSALEAVSIDVPLDVAGQVREGLRDPAALPVDRIQYALRLGMQSAKDLVVKDLSAFLATPEAGDAAAFRRWLATTIAAYEQWIGRIEHVGRPAPAVP